MANTMIANKQIAETTAMRGNGLSKNWQAI
jgi:hypothetical protein